MRDYRKLNVWEKSHQLVLEIYKATEVFPKEEQYGLTSQMRSAAVSVPANIVEGCSRSSSKDYSRFLEIAYGSASELEYYLILIADLGWLSHETSSHLSISLVEIKRMLGGLIRKHKAPGP
jgi:four helix bundle protein